MARPQNRKRPRADDLSREQPPAKKIKSKEHHSDWNHPPEFYDNLSKIWLTRRALRELDRRNNSRPLPEPPVPASDYDKDLARFARHGGPDLHQLRGYRLKANMSSSSSQSGATGFTKPTTNPSSATKTTRTSTKSRNFEQHMIDNHIYRDKRAKKPENRNEILKVIAAPRASLSPSRFDEAAFEAFQESDAQAKDEDDIFDHVIPVITGRDQAKHFRARNTFFGNLEALTDGSLAHAQPDFYYGAHPEQLDRGVRDELRHHIIPSTMEDKPMAPNFFMEAKGPDGTAAVVVRQAHYDGAMGARGMHSLQNYGEEEPVYDGNAYTYSSTYHAGQLKLYAHHVTAPTTPGGRPEYHMTQIDAYALTGKLETCVEGIGAFRNARDSAQRHRDSFIQAANARARQPNTEVASEAAHGGAAELQRYESPTSDEFVDCEDFESQAVGTKNYATSQDANQGPALPQYLYTEGQDSQESTSCGAVEPSMSFATSFTSSFSTPSHTGSKRNRESHSPPSRPQPHRKHDSAKSRTRKSQQAAKPSRRSSTSAKSAEKQPATEEDYWIWSSRHENWYHMNDDGSCTWADK